MFLAEYVKGFAYAKREIRLRRVKYLAALDVKCCFATLGGKSFAFLQYLNGAYRLPLLYMAIYTTLRSVLSERASPFPTVYHGASTYPTVPQSDDCVTTSS